MRFDANLSMLFTEEELLERPAAAARAGFGAVEIWWPFTDPHPSSSQVDAFVAALDRAQVQLVGLNFAAGDMAGGDRGLVSDPDALDVFRGNVELALSIGERTGCRVFNALYGNRRDDLQPEQQDQVALDNLTFAVASAAEIGATVVVEALNPWENPRYPLVTTGDAVQVLDRVESASGIRPKLLYDCYHAQRSEGNLIDTIRTRIGDIGHVQIADSPGRNEPGTGEINFRRVLEALRDAGYEGHVGLEYRPAGSTISSLTALEDLDLDREVVT